MTASKHAHNIGAAVCVPDDEVQILIQSKYHCAWGIIYSYVNFFFCHLIMVSVGIQCVTIADSVTAITDTNAYNVILNFLYILPVRAL